MKTSRGWIYKLPDPYRLMPYFPVDDEALSFMLGVSRRTAVRICKGEKALRHCETVYLQMLVFGLVPDPAALRGKWYIRDGVIRCHGSAFELALSFGELTAFVALRNTQNLLHDQIAESRARIRELENALREARNELPPNVLRFPAR